MLFKVDGHYVVAKSWAEALDKWRTHVNTIPRANIFGEEMKTITNPTTITLLTPEVIQ